jgi:hypothetical protein
VSRKTISIERKESAAVAKTAKPEQFLDLTFVNKIKASGLIEQLWGR